MTTNGQHIPESVGARSGPQTMRFDELRLEGGAVLKDASIAYETWGSLADTGDNVVLVCHALTGSGDVSGWWPGIVGPGLAIDTDRFFVVCANVLGSPYGSASPLTLDPSSGKPFGARFPSVTIRDTVNAHRRLLNELGVRSVIAAIGASMGGMQVLEWAFHRDLVRSIVPIAVGGRHSAWCIAWSEAQRQAIFTDPNWMDGDYYPNASPEAGLATARMIAMISYRSSGEFATRFGRDRMGAVDDTSEQPPFAAESYLRHQGAKLVSRFDANCYVQLTRQMDTHDVSRGRGDYLDVLRGISQPALVIGIRTDVLYPLDEQKELSDTMPNASLHVLESTSGHDSFLIETDHMRNVIREWIEQHAPAREERRAAGEVAPPEAQWKRLLRIEGEQPVQRPC